MGWLRNNNLIMLLNKPEGGSSFAGTLYMQIYYPVFPAGSGIFFFRSAFHVVKRAFYWRIILCFSIFPKVPRVSCRKRPFFFLSVQSRGWARPFSGGAVVISDFFLPDPD